MFFHRQAVVAVVRPPATHGVLIAKPLIPSWVDGAMSIWLVSLVSLAVVFSPFSRLC
jgi:hypothetical protein